MYAVLMFLYAVCPPFENMGVHNFAPTNTHEYFHFRLVFLCFPITNQKIRKSHASRALVSRAKAPPAKRSEKGYGDENDENDDRLY